MADIRRLVASASPTWSRKPREGSLAHKIQVDNITIKHLSRDNLTALIHKHRQKIRSRAALNDAMLQNIKKSKPVSKQELDKKLSAQESRTARSRTPTTPLPGTKILLRALSPDSTKSLPYGFQYRSDGEVSLTRKKSNEEQAGLDNRKDYTTLKQTLLKATMIHSRDERGDYTFSPLLSQLLKREARASKAPEGVDIFRFITKDYRQGRDRTSRAFSEPAFQNVGFLRDKPLFGRRFLVRENDRFINSMMQQIHQLDRSSSTLRYSASKYEGLNLEDLLQEDSRFVRSEPEFRSANYKPARNNLMDIPIGQAKSSFHMRYGVSSHVLEARKPLLDEYMRQEMEKTARTDVEIEEYINEMNKVMAENEKKQKREASNDAAFDFWQVPEDIPPADTDDGPEDELLSATWSGELLTQTPQTTLLPEKV